MRVSRRALSTAIFCALATACASLVGCPKDIGGGACPDGSVLLLSEVMPHPDTPDQPSEYIEVYNAGGQAVPAECVVIYEGAFGEGQGRTSECAREIDPGGYLVFTKNPTEQTDNPLATQLGVQEGALCYLAMALTDDDLFGVGYIDSSGSEHLLESVDCSEVDCPVSEGVSMNRDLGELEEGEIGGPGSWCASETSFFEGEYGSPGTQNHGCEEPPPPQDCPVSATVMLSEVMPHPDTPDQPSEYVEVYNAGGEAIPAACVVIYEGDFGEGQELGRTSDCSAMIPAGGYQVFTKNSTEQTPNPLADQLGVGEDDLCYLTLGLTDNEQFGVGYLDTGGTKHPLESVDCGEVDCPVSEGVSMNRHLPELLAGQVGGPGTWCASEDLYYEDQHASEHGTPGTENRSCGGGEECPASATIMLSEVMTHPSTVNHPTEYIEVYNAGNASIPAGCVVIYEGSFAVDQGNTADCDLEIPIDGYLVFAKTPAQSADQMGIPESELCGLSMTLTDEDLIGVGFLDTAGNEFLLESVDCGVTDCPVAEGVSMNRDLSELQAGQVGGPGTWCASQGVFHEDDEMTEHGTPGQVNEGC